MIRRPPRSTLSSSSAASDVYKRQDGFWVANDPSDENIVYTETQYGNAALWDKKIEESINIRPVPRKGEKTYRWYWDTPIIISPHQKERIYMAANKAVSYTHLTAADEEE